MSGRPGAPRYTREQRDALLHAVMVNGLSIAEAHRRAKAGKLGLPAFEIPYSSAIDIIRGDRDSYALRNPDVMRSEIDADILAMAAAARKVAARVKAQADPDPDLIRRAVQALKVARDAVATAPKRNTPTAPEPPHTTAPNVLDALGLTAAQPSTTT